VLAREFQANLNSLADEIASIDQGRGQLAERLPTRAPELFQLQLHDLRVGFRLGDLEFQVYKIPVVT